MHFFQANQLFKPGVYVPNLKALNRAEGPVQRFRALRATIVSGSPPPPQKKNSNLCHSSLKYALRLT